MLQFVLCICFIPVLFIAGVVYQWIGSRMDRKRFLTRGRMIHLTGGLKLYRREDGSGSPTVVFESGIAATSLNWQQVQEWVSDFARTVSYDRGGLGWSSPSPSMRTPSNLARELRAMLQQAGIAPPYVLVGHSFGGLVVRRYSIDYPHEVAGVLLVDAMRTEEWPPANETKQALLARGIRLTRIGVLAASLGLARLAVTSLLCGRRNLSRLMARTGCSRVLERIECEVDKMPRNVRPVVAAHWSRPGFYRGMTAHLEAIPASVEEMHCAEPIEAAPVILLTPDNSQPVSADGLGRLGLHARQVIAEKSGHWIHLDEPELVVDLIRGLVEECRIREQDRSLVLS